MCVSYFCPSTYFLEPPYKIKLNMDEMNFIPILVASLIPMAVGFAYYHKKTVGSAWMESLGKTEEELQEGFNMALVTIVGLVMSFLMAFLINALVEISHRDINDAGELIFASDYNFGHGAFHGLFYGLLFAMPILVTNGMYERKSWKNIFINVGYWLITISLMSGLMDAWN